MFHRLARAILRFAFHHFYNTFAFTYDFASALVSRGRWRAWTRAAIPHLVGKRVLEMPCGTGNLLLDLRAAGFAPIGVDLSPAMLRITQKKLARVGAIHPGTARQGRCESPVRARAQALPFATGAFDSITMTFPPSFVYDPASLAELQRVLRDDGRLIWVDAGRLLPRDPWSRLLDHALNTVGASAMPFTDFANTVLENAGFKTRIETAADEFSRVLVVIAEKRGSNVRQF